MIRLLVWAFWLLVFGTRPPKLLPKCPYCRDNTGWFMANTAAPFCEHALCSMHCDNRCKCLNRQIDNQREALSS